jgi:hypothetical protein
LGGGEFLQGEELAYDDDLIVCGSFVEGRDRWCRWALPIQPAPLSTAAEN